MMQGLAEKKKKGNWECRFKDVSLKLILTCYIHSHIQEILLLYVQNISPFLIGSDPTI